MMPKPAPNFFRPKIERLPARRRVTAILGFNCTDGVLMLADTEESTSMGTKSESDKLYRFFFPPGIVAVGGADKIYHPIVPAGIVASVGSCGTVVMGGAGDAHLIECANQELQQHLNTGFADGEDMKVRLNEFTSRFFNETIGAYRGFASDIVPNLSMLIAINSRNQTWLFKWEHDRVVLIPKHRHSSIGAGRIQMDPMLRNVQFSMPCSSMLLHGVRIMLQTKNIVVGVGGKTDAMALHRDNSTRFFGTVVTRQIEDLIEEIETYDVHVLYSVISDVLGNVASDDPNFAKLGGDIGMFREKYRAIVKP